MIGRQAVLEAASAYLRQHPEELLRLLRNALGLRLGVPIEGLQWLAGRGGGQGPRDIKIESDPPGVKVSATVELMKIPVRAQTTIFIERIRASDDELKVEVRLEGTTLRAQEGSDSPVAALINSGALDLSKAGNLAAHLPKVNQLLGESTGNRLVIDLMKHPKIAKSKSIRKAVGLVTSLVTVHGVESDEGHLDVVLRAFPRGVRGAARAVRDHILSDGPPWFKGMLPGKKEPPSRPGY